MYEVQSVNTKSSGNTAFIKKTPFSSWMNGQPDFKGTSDVVFKRTSLYKRSKQQN